MLTVIKDGKFTGTQYEQYTEDIKQFHMSQGDVCIDYPRLEVTQYLEDGRPEYPIIQDHILLQCIKDGKKATSGKK